MTDTEMQILAEARQYVAGVFANRVLPAFLFHSYEHTLDVVNASEFLANHYHLPDEDRFPLFLAAWFHDTGYSGGEVKNHEELGKAIAVEFLTSKNVDATVIERVSSCIMATRMPQSPGNFIEQILCDADLFHLGTDQFPEKNKLLRKEINLLHEDKISKKEWREMNIKFLRQHQYFTSYGKTYLAPIKQQFLQELVEKEEEKEKPEKQEKPDKPLKPLKPVAVAPRKTVTSTATGETDKDKKARESRTERGISTMFRLMSENHVSLSQMADSKANIMISVNTIVMSIMVSVLLGKLQFYPEYIAPTIILLLVCLSAVVFAILATRPNITRGTFTKEDIKEKKINLLFFGNFYNMSLQEYDWAMKEMMNDREYLNTSMVKDIYFLGVVLARKYKYLRLSYNIFMFGLIIAIVAFGIAFIFSPGG